MTAVTTDKTYDAAVHVLQPGNKLEVGKNAAGDIGGIDVLDGAQVREMAGGATDDTGYMRGTGNLSVQVSAAGNGNGADATDDVLFNYVLPAGALDAAGRQLTIQAAGTFAANGHNKRVKIFIGATSAVVGSAISGGTAICDTGTVTTSGGGWTAQVQVTKYGASGSNTQQASGAASACGTTHNGTSAPQLLTLTESGAINITVTGSSATSSAANDVLGNLLDVSFAN